MNNTISVRIYFLFSLFLLLTAYKLTTSVKDQMKQAQAKQAAAIERVLAAE